MDVSIASTISEMGGSYGCNETSRCVTYLSLLSTMVAGVGRMNKNEKSGGAACIQYPTILAKVLMNSNNIQRGYWCCLD